MLDRDICRGNGRGQRDIDGTGAAICRAGKIKRHGVAFNLERDFNLQRYVGDAIVIQKILCLPTAIGQVGQFGPHQHFGPVAKRIQRGAYRFSAVFCQQFVQTLYPKVQRAKLTVQIALCRLRQAGVTHQDVDDVGLDCTSLGQTDRGQHEGLLKRIRGGRVIVAGHSAAHIMPMPYRGEIAKQLSVMEIGSNKAHIAKMRAAKMGVVEDIDISVFQITIFGSFVDHGLNGKRHHPDKDRQTGFSLYQRVARQRMIQTMRRIVRLGDDGIESRAKQGRVHFVCNLFHPPGQNGKRDRVNSIGHWLALVSAMSFQTSWRVRWPSVTSNRSINRMPSNAVPSGHSPDSVPRQYTTVASPGVCSASKPE